MTTIVLYIYIYIKYIYIKYIYGSSAGKESTCNSGDHSLIPGSGSSLEKEELPTPVFLGFPGGSDSERICLQCGRPGFNPWVRKLP